MGRLMVAEREAGQNALLRDRVELAKQAVMGLVVSTMATVVSALNSVTSFLTDPFLTPSLTATLRYLEETELRTLRGEKRYFKAKTLWEKTGAVIMAVRRPG